MAPRSIPQPLVAVIASLAAAATAQVPTPQQAPLPVATPTSAPSPTVAPSPTPAAPPVVLATPALTPRPGIDDVPVFVPNPRPTQPRPTPSVTPVASPSATSTISPSPTPAPTPASTARPPIETVILPPERDIPIGVWIAGGTALLLIVLGWLGLRRQRDDEEGDGWDDGVFEQGSPPEPVVEPMSALGDARARLSVALRPIRAGLNLISATAECEVTVANIGGLPAENVRASLRLMSAREGQEGELAAFYADTGGRLATPAFSLAPGEERCFRAITALPHEAIHSIEAGGRPMFVPVVALSVRYRDDANRHHVGQAFVLGVDQGGSAKLAPFWLDGPARSYDSVAARPHGGPAEY